MTTTTTKTAAQILNFRIAAANDADAIRALGVKNLHTQVAVSGSEKYARGSEGGDVERDVAWYIAIDTERCLNLLREAAEKPGFAEAVAEYNERAYAVPPRTAYDLGLQIAGALD